ncbi:MAG: hypothetical protein U0Y68_24880, partial [Blastocatellia bacterium]
MLQQGELLPPGRPVADACRHERAAAMGSVAIADVRRLQLRAQAADAVPVQRSDARFKAWYSWRDSFLQWPELARLRRQPACIPFLADLLKQVGLISKRSLIANVPPVAQPATLSEFLNATTLQLDPYGWDILKRMGLCVSFSLHDARTGEPVSAAETLSALRQALAKDAANNPLLRHLHLELLFQPAASRRLAGEAAAVTSEQLLALLQISLRPALKQIFSYMMFEISASGDAFSSATERALTLDLHTGGKVCRWIALTEDEVGAPSQLSDGKLTVTVPASGKLLLLCQSASPDGMSVTAKGATVHRQAFAPTDWLAEYFPTADDEWIGNAGISKELREEINTQWGRFQTYLLRLNPAAPANANDPRIELPKADDWAAREALQDWLTRFFTAGGDVAPGEQETRSGPWLATAYPRVVSPVRLTPDASGRLHYHHPIEDRWAHTYRYYILPHGRYDQLWETLAQSARLYANDSDLRAGNLARLQAFVPPAAGGLDVTWERLHSLAPPLVLYSGRLDLAASAAAPSLRGKTWEVVLEKHPEQALIERNRTLQRQLGYRQISHTLLRRFAYADRVNELLAVLARQSYEVQLKLVEGPAPQTLPSAYETPDHLNLRQPTPEEMLTLDLPQRLRAYTPEVLVLQWESLPYFYEHRLLLVAQSNAVVSPVTDVVQRDLEYVSPPPQATLEVRTTDDNTRQLIARIRLGSYWDCLPPHAQTHWQIEKPHANDGAARKLSSLPDAEVAYQFLLTRSGVVEAQADLRFNAEQTAGYEARPLGQQLTVTPLRLLPPGTGEHAQDPFYLEAALTLNHAPTLKSKPLPLSGEFTHAAYVQALFDLTDTPNLPPEFGRVVTRPAADASLETRAAFAAEWLLTRVVTTRPAALSAALQAKVEFIPPPRPVPQSHYLLRLHTALTTDEQTELRAAMTADQAALASLFAALEDRDALTQLAADWNCETAISSRAEFAALVQGNDRFSFPLPTSCVLALDGTLSAEEIDKLFAQPLDPAFETALRQLIERMADGVTTIVEASLSVEQVAEINPHAVLPTLAEPKLCWRGTINETQQQALERWTELSIFGQQFRTLLHEAAAVPLGFAYTPAKGDPANDNLPVVLQGRLQLSDTEMRWQGLFFGAAEAAALQSLQANAAYSTGFRAAIKALLIALTQPGNPTLKVEVAMPAGWQPRPQQSTLSAALQSRLLIGNARL